jgi:hypothetical protein
VPQKHAHYWHDTDLDVDFIIPETFMDKIRADLATPLAEAEDAIKAALDALDSDSVAWIILNGYLHPEPIEENLS